MSKLFIYVIGEGRHDAVLHVSGMSTKTYTFHWYRDEPSIGGCYAYEPKSQKEIDDIMASQFHGIFNFSLFVPGAFDAKEEPSKQSAPEPTPAPESEEPINTEPESESEEEPVNQVARFEFIEATELPDEIGAIKDKGELTAIIEAHGAKAPAKQSGMGKFKAAAFEAIVASREVKDEGEEESNESEQIEV